MSLLKAAAKVLAESDEPMRISEIYDAIKAQNLWVPVNGRTPELSLYSGIYREIKTKGENARFRKLDRGLYTTRR